ncbi:MAG: hypothetical protein ACYDAC_12575 [Candidatus Dormibacteria bacterium]
MGASRLYERAVLRPFAEQLVEAAGVQPRQQVVELLPRSDMLALALASLGPGAAALPVRDAAELETVDAHVALGLFVGGGGAAPLVRAAAARLRVHLLVWPAPSDPRASTAPSIEHRLAAAFEDVAGDVPSPLSPALDAPPLVGWEAIPCTDVCRFDSARDLVAAVCAWHGVVVDSVTTAALAEHLAASPLARHTGFDGTLRIPVTALLLRSR